MKSVLSRIFPSLLLLCAFSIQAQDQLPNLTDPAPAARFTITGRDWPSADGAASICLWKDDKLAALSITVDDNSAPNINWWLTQADTYDFKMTWFVITSLIGGSNPTSHGTWPVYSNVLTRGHEVQSHSVTHDNSDAEYRDSQIAIEANLPGNKCDFLAYPGGSEHPLDPAAAALYYASARGTAGAINTANKITYMNVYATSSPNLTNAAADWSYLPNLFNSSHSKYRGWSVQIFHWISDYSVNAQPLLDFYDANRENLWCGRYGDVAKYGQQRDTATLTVISNTAGRITMTLTDQMLDSRFNYPLTVKVKMHPGWNGVEAVQNGIPVESKVVSYNGSLYALVQAVPDQGEISLTPGSAAGFTASPVSGWAPLTVTFTDTSTISGITNRFWDFGDGFTTNTSAPGVTHTYTSAGTSTVQLIVSSPSGTDTNIQTGLIRTALPVEPAAVFNASPASGTAPLSVTFTDTSTGSITNRLWDFGDGSVTNTAATSVSHTYTAAGNHTVRLTVSGPAGSSTNTQAGLIRVTAAVSQGNLIVYDSFSDAVQTNWAVPSSVPSTWFTTNVIPNTVQPQANRSQITAGSLSYPGLQASAGNSWTTREGFDDYYKDVSGVSGLVAGDAVYYSFLLKVNPSDAVSQYYMRLYNTANIFSSGLAFGFGLSADLTQIGFSLGNRNGNFSTTESIYLKRTGFDYNSSDTFLIVLGYLRGTTVANSSMNLWINPDSSTFGTATPPTPTLTLPGYNYTQEAVWNKLEYNFNGTGTGTAEGQTIDEFRIARDWAGAVPAEISAPAGDADSDGLPDEWEEQYFGGSTNAHPQAMAANGINTLYETYVAGLDPTNASSVFLISDIRPLTPENILQWNAVSGRVYSIYWTTNLLSGFQCLQSNIPWTQSSFTNENPDPNGFYRLSVRIMP